MSCVAWSWSPRSRVLNNIPSLPTCHVLLIQAGVLRNETETASTELLLYSENMSVCLSVCIHVCLSLSLCCPTLCADLRGVPAAPLVPASLPRTAPITHRASRSLHQRSAGSDVRGLAARPPSEGDTASLLSHFGGIG